MSEIIQEVQKVGGVGVKFATKSVNVSNFTWSTGVQGQYYVSLSLPTGITADKVIAMTMMPASNLRADDMFEFIIPSSGTTFYLTSNKNTFVSGASFSIKIAYIE